MEFLKKLGIKDHNFGASTGTKWFKTKDQGELEIYSPADGKYIASVYQSSPEDYEKIIQMGLESFIHWRKIPAPKRGEIVRQICLKLR